MMLLPLQYSLAGGLVGATLTAFAIKNNQEITEPVNEIWFGAQWGAIFPQAVKIAYVAAEIFGALAVIALDFSIKGLFTACASPYALPVLGIAALAALAFKFRPTKKEAQAAVV